MQMRIEAIAERSLQRNTIDLFLGMYDQDRVLQRLAQPVLFAPHEQNSRSQPALSMIREEWQVVMDELWRAGVRPTDVGSPGELRATERHLETMQDIALGLLRRDGIEV